MTLKEADTLKEGDIVYFVKPYHKERVYLYNVIPVIYIGECERCEHSTVKYCDKDIYIPVCKGAIWKTKSEAYKDAYERIQENVITEQRNIKIHKENIEVLNNALAEYELNKLNNESKRTKESNE